MKGLAITILLAILQVSAMATGGGSLLTNGPETVLAAPAVDPV